jgi:hypothetical protein
MTNIFLHVGFHKTATSSFQDTCMENSNILESQGFLYPALKYNNKVINNHGIHFNCVFMDEPETFDFNILEGVNDFIDDISSEIKQQILLTLNSQEFKNIIFSGEAISVLKKNELSKIKELFDKNNINLTVLCCVRPPYSFLCSDLQEVVKVNVATMENIVVRPKFKHVSNLIEVFGNDMVFFSFAEACKYNGGPTKYLLNKIGINTENINERNANKGLGNLSTRLYAYLNIFYPNIKNGVVNSKGRGSKIKNFDDKPFLLTKSEIQKIKIDLDKENKLLFDLLGDKFIDVEYKESGELLITIEQAYDIYDFHRHETFMVLKIIEFILNNKGFELSALFTFIYEKNDADYLRDLSLVISDDLQAIKAITYAHLLRPNGPFIKQHLLELLGKD